MKKLICSVSILLTLVACSNKPISKEDYSKSDKAIELISENILNTSYLNKELEVDHSRLAIKEGSELLPSRVIMFNNPKLEEKLLERNRLIALELPFKILSYSTENHTKVIWNDIDYISERYDVELSDEIEDEYEKTFSTATNNIPTKMIQSFPDKDLEDNGIITLTSPYNYEETYEKAMEFIKSNSDVVVFGSIDYQSRLAKEGMEINKTTLILFGGPKPGGKAMNGSQTLGLDGFPQKLLIWEDVEGQIQISYNDLLEMAERQGVKKSLTLRVIQYRLNNLFPKEFKIMK